MILRSVQKQPVWEGRNGISTHRETGSTQQGYAQTVRQHQGIGRPQGRTELSSERALLLG